MDRPGSVQLADLDLAVQFSAAERQERDRRSGMTDVAETSRHADPPSRSPFDRSGASESGKSVSASAPAGSFTQRGPLVESHDRAWTPMSEPHLCLGWTAAPHRYN